MLLFQHQAAGGGSNGCSEATLEEILSQILIKLTSEQLPLGQKVDLDFTLMSEADDWLLVKVVN